MGSSFVKTLDESMNQALGKLHQDVMAANSGGANTAKDLAALRSEVEELPRKALSGLAPQIDDVCNGQAGDLRTLAESSAEMGAGLSQLKSSIGRLANNTASELQTTRDEIEQICNSLCNVSKSWGGSNIRSQRMSRSMMSSESRSMDIRTAGG